jgi:hypothetical protein
MLNRPPDLTRIVEIEDTAVDATTRFESAKTKHLYDWWASANDGQMPRRRQFDILSHRPIVANLFLTEVLPDGNFQFRLLGEEVIQIIGRNRTGETVRQAAEGEYGHELYTYYRSVMTGRICRRCTGALFFATKGARRFESIDCPLADDNGEQVAVIIGVMDVVR